MRYWYCNRHHSTSWSCITKHTAST